MSYSISLRNMNFLINSEHTYTSESIKFFIDDDRMISAFSPKQILQMD